MESEQFTEIRDLISKEDTGFLGRLEDLVLFEEDDFTAQFPTLGSISHALEDERRQDDYIQIDRLQLKRDHFNLRSSFPYDYINLDFCQYYYPIPPGMLRINKTVERLLDWQKRPSEDGDKIQLEDFVLAVTCRHDADFPEEAEARLTELIRENCTTSCEYKERLKDFRGGERIEDWVRQNKQDFFFAGWPKDIARTAMNSGWAMEILEYVYYQRTGDEQNPYIIACLIAKFWRDDLATSYVPTALFALSKENRKLIGDIDRNSRAGKEVIENLRGVVTIRNEQARRKLRPELPDPDST